MSNLSDYIDGDGLVSHVIGDDKTKPWTQNGVHYTGIAYVLTGDRGYMEAVSDAFDKFGYHRNSVTNDKMSYDDLYVLAAYRKDVRWDFIKRFFWHPAKESWAIRWWFIRNLSFVMTVLFPRSKSFVRDLAIYYTGVIGKDDADAFKGSFLLSELYPCREFAKRQLRKRSLKRWPKYTHVLNHPNTGGLMSAFIEYFGPDHPLCSLMAEFERKRSN